MAMTCAVDDNRQNWEKRSQECGATLRSVLFSGMPEVVNEHFHQWHSRFIAANLDSGCQGRILDVGCGYGRLSSQVAMLCPQAAIIGMDIAQNYAKLYEGQTGRPAVVGRIENIPLQQPAFERVLCVTVLMYVDDATRQSALAELLRQLEPEGRLILIEPSTTSLPFQTACGLTRLFRRRKPGAVVTGGHYFPPRELEAAIEQAGGTVMTVRRCPASTIFILLAYAIGRFLPAAVARPLLLSFGWLDKVLGGLKLPSVFVAMTVKPRR